MAAARGWGKQGNVELLFNGYRVPVLQDEKSSGDWLHNNLNVLNTMNCTLKRIKMVKFM